MEHSSVEFSHCFYMDGCKAPTFAWFSNERPSFRLEIKLLLLPLVHDCSAQIRLSGGEWASSLINRATYLHGR
jgi:hypothetical protein